MTKIYGLRCPLRQTIRYIGKADDVLKRFAIHLSETRTAKRKNHKQRWVAKLAQAGLQPEPLVLFHVPAGMDWAVAERFFIAAATHMQFPLTNSTTGGEGLKGLDAKIRKRLSAASKRKPIDDPVGWQKFLDAQKAHFADPKNRAAQSVRAKKQFSSAEARAELAKNRDAWLAANMEQIRETARAQWADPVRRARIQKATTSPKANAKRKASLKKYASTPAGRAALSAACKARWAKCKGSEHV